jgi:hypothetical protein
LHQKKCSCFSPSHFDSTGVKLYIFIHNEVRDFDKNSTQPEIRVNRVRDNEGQLYVQYLTNFGVSSPEVKRLISYVQLAQDQTQVGCHVQNFVNKWKQVTSDPWVLKQFKYYH